MDFCFRGWRLRPSHIRIDLPGGQMLGRQASRTLQQHGAASIGPGGLSDLRARASERLAALWNSMADVHCVLWFDNYVRPRAFVDPNRGFVLYDCTVFGVLHTAQLPDFGGLPHVTQLADQRQVVVTALLAMYPVFLELLAQVQAMNFAPTDVRVPLAVAHGRAGGVLHRRVQRGLPCTAGPVVEPARGGDGR